MYQYSTCISSSVSSYCTTDNCEFKENAFNSSIFPQSPKQITQQNPELTLQRCYRDCFFLFHSDTSIFNIILSKKILWRTLKASDVLGRPKTNFYGILLLIWCSVEIRDKITRSWKGKTLGLNCYSIEVAAGG